jgi:hypothetical protein
MAAAGYVEGPRWRGNGPRRKVYDLDATPFDRRQLLFLNRDYQRRPVEQVRLIGGELSGQLHPWPNDDPDEITIISVGTYVRSIINAKLAHFKRVDQT